MLAEQKQFKCIPLLSMTYLIGGFAPYIFGRNCLILFHCKVSLTSLIFFSFWFILSDIIAEIYGYKIAKNIFWSSVFCQLIFALISFFTIKVFPLSQQIYNAYLTVFDGFSTETIYSSLIFVFAWRLNTFLLLKWKTLMHGRYFWLRSIGSSFIGILLFETILFIFYTFITSSFHGYSSLKDLALNLLFRIVSVIILSGIAQFIIALIKSIELIEDKKIEITEPQLFIQK